MFNLRIVQANFGDCLILEYGSSAQPRYLLIDGGPANVFGDHLQSELEAIAAAGRRLDLVAISHVDEDHITGVLDLFALLQDQRTNGDAELIGVDGLWHNSFSKTVDPDDEIEPQFNGLAGIATPASAAAILGVGEGNRLRQFALQLDIPLNEQFPDELIRVDDAPDPLEFGNLALHIVGPTQANLDELRTDWLEWLDKFGPDLAGGNPQVMANADNSVPNLSSVMFLAAADDKTVLFTGDGRSDHLLQGLEARGLLAADGTFHVDVLKVMHHGSDRNATKTFFKRVTADTYVLSANGNPDNPDLATLIWIVESAKQQGRSIHIVFTNETPATIKLPDEYPPAEYGYTVETMAPGQHAMVLPLAN
jgi:ribonuclease BN (tRNA processing enzyme)